MILYIYIAQGRGRQPIGDIILMSTERPYHFGHLLQISKNLFELWFYTHFFMLSYMYIALGHGQTTPRGQNFDVSRNLLSFQSFATSVKKNLFEVWFYTHFFIILYMYVAPRQGQTTPWGQNSDVNKNILSFRSFVTSFKKIFLKSDFIHIFSWFYICI